MTVNYKPALIEHVYPAMRVKGKPSMPPGETLRSMLLLVARQMADARGLDPASLPEAGSCALPALQGIDFSQADPTLLGDVYSSLLPGRRRRGSYYTPQALAEIIIRQVVTPGRPEKRILDPAMGSGHFLIAAARAIACQAGQRDERQARWAALHTLGGVDDDPAAVEWATISLWLWAACPGTNPSMLLGRLVCADALLDDSIWQDELAPPFDAVIGNPPYASAITRARTPHPTYQAVLQSRYASARGSFDLSVPFVERAITLCREHGRCGLVLPNKLLAADYAHWLRSWLSERVTVEAIVDASQGRPFAASVYPVALVLRNTPPAAADRLAVYGWKPSPADSLYLDSAAFTSQIEEAAAVRVATQADLHTAPGRSWSTLLDPDWEVLRRHCRNTIPLGEIASLASGLAVGEAYSLRPAVFDAPGDHLPPNTFRLLTSGLIRRFDCAWGRTQATYLKTTYQRPAVSADALPPRRLQQATARKIVVAGMGKAPRALVDGGQAQASVSTTIITDAAWPLDALCAILNSQLVGRLCRAIFGALALNGGHMRFGKPELARLPLPAITTSDPRLSQLDALSKQRVAATTTDLARALEDKIDALIYTLYN